MDYHIDLDGGTAFDVNALDTFIEAVRQSKGDHEADIDEFASFDFRTEDGVAVVYVPRELTWISIDGPESTCAAFAVELSNQLQTAVNLIQPAGNFNIRIKPASKAVEVADKLLNP